jgi:hypothetical protein
VDIVDVQHASGSTLLPLNHVEAPTPQTNR